MEELLKQMKEYIEASEETIDGEWGGCRELQELMKDGAMPDIYHNVLLKLSEF